MPLDVTVYLGEEKGVSQPETFRCCPLGVQFYSERELATYEVMEFKLNAPAGVPFIFSGPMTCSGVVVHCQKDIPNDRFRIWLMFLDLPESVRSQLECMGKSGEFLCPHCENF